MEQTLELTHNLLATKGQRFANYIIDFIIKFLIAAAIGIISGLLYQYFDIVGPYYWVTNMNKIEEFLLGYVILFFYYILFEATLQRSPAKFITGTKVVTFDGSKPSFGDIVKRTLCRMIPFNEFSFLGEPDKGWHDSISQTYVIDIKKYNQALQLKNSFEEIGATTE
ncbi:RDD family protein [Flavobacterium sp. Sd200]|uniref:RDD family protein n=1 Tax=Flavobacterium sp. Sd200 TaxID=2692211 RepID=UPI0013680018|nr:RDD family protein [Flavobacterium sp. Sd200]MXN93068.1 RDD family protein [Flavobacterium sp. Sd200]